MQETQKVLAIILKREAFRERDSRVKAFTRENGIVDLVARGTISLSSKLAGHLEPLCLCELMLVPGRQFNYIGSARALAAFPRIKSDYTGFFWVGTAVSKFLAMAKNGQADPSLFSLLYEYLDFCENNQVDQEYFQSVFLLKLLAQMGYCPELYVCVESREKILGKDLYFDFSQGGLCRERTDNSRKISQETVKAMRFALHESFAPIASRGLSAASQTSFCRIVERYLQYQA